MTRRELHTDLSVTLPDSRDFFGSIEALVRLQETYQLPTSELANGVVHGDSADHPMSGFEMYAMGKASLRAGSFGQAVQWLDLAIAAKDGSFSPEDAMADLADAYQLVMTSYNYMVAAEHSVLSCLVADRRLLNCSECSSVSP